MNSSVEFLVTRLLSAPSSSGPTCLGSMPASVRNGSSGSSGTGAPQGVEAGERLGSQDMGDGDERGLADRAERRRIDSQRRAEVPTQVFDHQADGDVVSYHQPPDLAVIGREPVSYTHLRAHETRH